MPLKKNHRLYNEGMMETRRKCEDHENCLEKDSRLTPSKHLSAIEIQEELVLISRQLERVLNYNIPELDNSELEFDQSPSEIHFSRAHGFDEGKLVSWPKRFYSQKTPQMMFNSENHAVIRKYAVKISSTQKTFLLRG